jgi:hypothetical protein
MSVEKHHKTLKTLEHTSTEMEKKQKDLERGALMNHVRGDEDAAKAALDMAKDVAHHKECVDHKINHVRKQVRAEHHKELTRAMT